MRALLVVVVDDLVVGVVVGLAVGAALLRAAALEAQVFEQIAAQNTGRGDVLLFEDEMSPDSVRKLCDAVAGKCGGRCAVFAGADSAWKYAMGQPGGDLRELTKSLNAALHGRGGGKAGGKTRRQNGGEERSGGCDAREHGQDRRRGLKRRRPSPGRIPEREMRNDSGRKAGAERRTGKSGRRKQRSEDKA